jgi:glycosyltransferase involved in cell wall biosynthesis
MAAAPGVSVVICTHNGAARLAATLAHLAAQVVPDGLAWEVLVVDNASTDDTARVVAAAWPRGEPAPLRIVSEPTPGLGHARARGLAEAHHEIVGFVGDDNWVATDWIATVWEIMAARPAVGACGGDAEAVPEGDPPAWFTKHADLWAIGPQGDAVTRDDAGYLRGAGLALRKSAWEELTAAGFEPMLVGRRGLAMTSGEDTEVCLALRLAGWRLRYDPRLRLRHFLPATRLTWDYARRGSFGWGHGSAWLDHYQLADGRPGLRQSWTWQLVSTGWRLGLVGLLALGQPREGSSIVLRREVLRGQLAGLLAQRRSWGANRRRVRDAAWRRPRA